MNRKEELAEKKFSERFDLIMQHYSKIKKAIPEKLSGDGLLHSSVHANKIIELELETLKKLLNSRYVIDKEVFFPDAKPDSSNDERFLKERLNKFYESRKGITIKTLEEYFQRYKLRFSREQLIWELNKISKYFIEKIETEILENNIMKDNLTGLTKKKIQPEHKSSDSIERDCNFFELFWDILHPKIVDVAKSRFEAEHYADSVEAALKEINKIIKAIVKKETGEEFDGANLMNRAFSLNKPIVFLDDLDTQTGKDIQKGYMQLFAGSMSGIRNPKAHDNININKERAVHFLFLCSLLMFKIDDAI